MGFCGSQVCKIYCKEGTVQLKLLMLFYIFLSPLFLFGGCASTKALGAPQPEYSRVYKAGYDETWRGVRRALEELGIDIKEKKQASGDIETEWAYRESEKTMSLLDRGYWKERYKMYLSLLARGDATVVNIRSIAEEKAPGGAQAYRWIRKPSNGEVEEIVFNKIDKVLAGKEEK
jgi:hypothetical protein